jgi:hemoglobin
MSEPTLYDRLGGEPTLRALVDRFYDLMDTRPDAATIRGMHPGDLSTSRQRLFLFLSMWTGGPRTYLEERGHPRMRMRHLPFPIDTAARDAWMRCMDLALAEVVDDPYLRGGLHDAFLRLADHMRNQEE